MAHPLLLLVSSPSLFLKVIFLLFFQAQRLKYNLELEVAAVGVCVCGGGSSWQIRAPAFLFLFF